MTTMTCEEARKLLTAYGDGELELSRALELEAHLATCAACTQALHAQRGIGRVVREAATYHAAPAALRARLAEGPWKTTTTAAPPQEAAPPAATRPAIAAPEPLPLPASPTHRRLARWERFAMPLAAALVLVVGMDVFLAGRQQRGVLTDEVVSSHVRSLMVSHLDDVISTDQHTVKPWFAGKLDFSPPVHDLAAQGFALAGGRIDYLDHRAVAALDYRRRQHVINLFVWPASSPGADAPGPAIALNGYHVVHWTGSAMQWWAVSDLNAAELEEFVERIRAADAMASPPA